MNAMAMTTLSIPAWSPFSPMTRLNGLRTTIVDVNQPHFQVDAEYRSDKTALWKHGLEEDGWTMAHNAVRGEISVFKNVLSKLGNNRLSAWEVDSLQTWWSGHLEHVHDHHANEDAKFSPFMAARIHVPPKLTTDHEPLVRLLEQIDARVSGLAEGASVSGLRKEWSKYENMMLPHLHEEEMVSLPLLRAYFTPEEVGKKVEEILSDSPPVALGSFFFFMGGTKEAVMPFMEREGIPWFVWHLAFKGHLDAYIERMHKHSEALLHGEPPAAAPAPLYLELGLTLALVLASARLGRGLRRKWRSASRLTILG